jgi:hypothetical protein
MSFAVSQGRYRAALLNFITDESLADHLPKSTVPIVHLYHDASFTNLKLFDAADPEGREVEVGEYDIPSIRLLLLLRCRYSPFLVEKVRTGLQSPLPNAGQRLVELLV